MRPVREYVMLPFRVLLYALRWLLWLGVGVGFLVWILLDLLPFPRRKGRNMKTPERFTVCATVHPNPKLACLHITRGTNESPEAIDIPLSGIGIDRLVFELAQQRMRITQQMEQTRVKD